MDPNGVKYFQMSCDTPKEIIISEADKLVRRYSEQDKLYRPIHFIETTCKSNLYAKAFLEDEAHPGCCLLLPQLAVKYQQRTPTARFWMLMKEKEALTKEIEDKTYFRDALLPKGQITCKFCKSVIKTSRNNYLENHYNCPVCNHDLRPESTQKEYLLKGIHLKQLEREILEESGKGKIDQVLWLVRITYRK